MPHQGMARLVRHAPRAPVPGTSRGTNSQTLLLSGMNRAISGSFGVTVGTTEGIKQRRYLPKECATNHSVIPVSYTHLDVYKRQFLTKVPTPTIERQLLADLSNVYAEYFTSLSDQGRDADAFSVIEKARGRLEEQAIEHHEVIPPHEATTAEQRLTNLNLQLLNTDDADARQHILETIYDLSLIHI